MFILIHECIWYNYGYIWPSICTVHPWTGGLAGEDCGTSYQPHHLMGEKTSSSSLRKWLRSILPRWLFGSPLLGVDGCDGMCEQDFPIETLESTIVDRLRTAKIAAIVASRAGEGTRSQGQDSFRPCIYPGGALDAGWGRWAGAWQGDQMWWAAKVNHYLAIFFMAIGSRGVKNGGPNWLDTYTDEDAGMPRSRSFMDHDRSRLLEPWKKSPLALWGLWVLGHLRNLDSKRQMNPNDATWNWQEKFRTQAQLAARRFPSTGVWRSLPLRPTTWDLLACLRDCHLVTQRPWLEELEMIGPIIFDDLTGPTSA